MTEIETVQTFVAALEALDIERALSLAAPDIVYQNVPLPPARGHAAFAKQSLRSRAMRCSAWRSAYSTAQLGSR
jgi:limonene-1,2-epoxide hydrolase